jgi:predicted naringenin-chalcone synthase
MPKYFLSKSQLPLMMIAVESPTITAQLNDFSMSTLSVTIYFGDGAACVLLSSAADN